MIFLQRISFVRNLEPANMPRLICPAGPTWKIAVPTTRQAIFVSDSEVASHCAVVICDCLFAVAIEQTHIVISDQWSIRQWV